MKRIWEITLMMETDINDFISIEDHVVTALKEHCDACCVTHAHPLPELGSPPFERQEKENFTQKLKEAADESKGS